jgi:predicted transcriptional regulator
MPRKHILDRISVYLPQSKTGGETGERLLRLSEKKDRSINYLVVDAILEYLKREERKD